MSHQLTSMDDQRQDESRISAIVNQADSDAQLFSTLCEIDKQNYLFLFERCKACNVNARQLRYFEKEHIRELVPKTHLGILAEFEYLLNEWKIKNGFGKATTKSTVTTQQATATTVIPKIVFHTSTMTTPVYTESRGTNIDPMELPAFTLPTTTGAYMSEEMVSSDLLKAFRYDEESQICNVTSPGPCIDRDIEIINKYPLTSIIPTVLAKCQQKYKANRGLLTEVERRLLSGAIIDYFISRRIHLKAHMIDNLAEQIAQQFPTESKRAWYDRKNCKGRGRLYVKLYNSHRSKDKLFCKKRKLLEETCSSTECRFPEDEAPEFDEEAQQVQNWLKCNKCEDMNEVINMWQDTLNYRRAQFRRIQQGCEESVAEMLENWPSYKWPNGHLLLSLDFNNMFPLSTTAFRQRWPVYMTKIVTLMEAELKDGASVELFKQFKMARNILNEGACLIIFENELTNNFLADSSECTLINLLHAITKPSRCFSTPQGVRRFCITESQNAVLRLATHALEMDTFNEAHPCIFVMGDNFLNVEECYVAFRNIRYKMKFSDALAASMHFFALFKIDYPLATLNFWRFVRGYFFDIHVEDETSYAVMDNIVKYLESCNVVT